MKRQKDEFIQIHVIHSKSRKATEITLNQRVIHYSSYLLGVDGHLKNGALVVKQRVLRYDEDPAAGVKNLENFALFCGNKETGDIVNGVKGKDHRSFKLPCKITHIRINPCGNVCILVFCLLPELQILVVLSKGFYKYMDLSWTSSTLRVGWKATWWTRVLEISLNRHL